MTTRNCIICLAPYAPHASNLKRGLGLTCSRICGYKAASKKMRGENNPMWKKEPAYASLHEWIINNFDKPKICASCGVDKNIDIANISQEYKRELSDWEWLCRRCHMKKDGRMNNLKQYKIAS